MALDGLLMTIDHFTMYTVYKVFLCLLFQSSTVVLYEWSVINGDWRKLIIKYICISYISMISYSNNWESKRFKTATP
jgi:hypothetical protein